MTARRVHKDEGTRPVRLASGTTNLSLGKRCIVIARSGQPCKTPPVRGKNKCWFHSGNNARVCGARGGRRRAIFNPEALETLPVPTNGKDLLLLLFRTLTDVRSGKLEPRVANSVSAVASVCLQALEIVDLENRLAALEEVQMASEAAVQ